MIQGKFNPIPESQAAAISYDASVVAKMSVEEFRTSPLASLLFMGQKVDDDYKRPYLDAWHADAQRLVKEATPVKAPPPAKDK